MVLVGIITAGKKTEHCTVRTEICVCCSCPGGYWSRSVGTVEAAPEDAGAPRLTGQRWQNTVSSPCFKASACLPGIMGFLGQHSELVVQAQQKKALVIARWVILCHPGKENEPGSSGCYCGCSSIWRWSSSVWLDSPAEITASSSSWSARGTAVISAVQSAFFSGQTPLLALLMISAV